MNKLSQKLSITTREAEDKKDEAKVDLELVRRCQAGNEAAFSALVERYQRKVYSIALGMVKNPEDAMDISQDAFIKVHRHIGGFQGSSSFYTWLYRIVFNLCIDHLRRMGNRVHMEFDETIGSKDALPEAGAALGSGLDTDPSKVMGRKELAERIRVAVEALPPYHRAVIVMREIEGMSYAEMASAMKVSKGTIMSRLHHARQKLQQSLGEYLEDDMVIK